MQKLKLINFVYYYYYYLVSKDDLCHGHFSRLFFMKILFELAQLLEMSYVETKVLILFIVIIHVFLEVICVTFSDYF